jgi:hypothetical protein
VKNSRGGENAGDVGDPVAERHVAVDELLEPFVEGAIGREKKNPVEATLRRDPQTGGDEVPTDTPRKQEIENEMDHLVRMGDPRCRDFPKGHVRYRKQEEPVRAQDDFSPSGHGLKGMGHGAIRRHVFERQ